jgi:hypothetical protein
MSRSRSASRSLEPIVLRVPGGTQYHLNVSRDDLAGWMAPDRKAPEQPGPPLEVEISHRGERYVIPVGAGELAHLLSQATLEADHAGGHPEQPRPVPNPARGRGLRDPDAHRLGPNAGTQDPAHRGITRRRTP